MTSISENIEDKVNELFNFFEKSSINYNKYNWDKKQAYPNNDQYIYIPGQHNTQKWLQAVKNIYLKETEGINRVSAIKNITSGWNLMETYDFLNWLRFYESGDHMKYKVAQLWYENGAPGYFLHVKQDPPKEPEPTVSGKDIDFARDSIADQSEKKQIIEKQRNKIIGRLDSAEKLLRSPDGQIFSGKEFESLMEAIYQLKKKVQMVNKISTSIRLYEDIIIRQANILHKNGFIKAADVLYSIAQTPGASGEQAKGEGENSETALTPASPNFPTQPSGSPGGLPSLGPGMPQPPGSPPSPENDNSPSVEENTQPKGISEFLEGMETSKLTTLDDEHEINDNLEIIDNNADLDVSNLEDELLVTEAQVAPIDVPMTDSPAPAPLNPSPVSAPSMPDTSEKEISEEPLEVTEDDMITPGDKESLTGERFNTKIDSMLASVTIADIVAELEDLAKVFKVREIPRKLSLVDMMLDSKGLASYFPSLSEAQNKALESNNYISTRVEDILSKLRGALTTKDIDLKGGNVPESPEINNIKNKLQLDEEKEKARKQMRKEQETAELSGKGKETPEVEIAEDLGAPVVPLKPSVVSPTNVK